MPYIKQERRIAILDEGEPPQNAGELNFIVSTIINQYMLEHGLCYQTINDIRGAYENALTEWYTRVVVPYERIKTQENGDVYSKEILSGGASDGTSGGEQAGIRNSYTYPPLGGPDSHFPP